MPFVVSFVGKSESGKTTLLEELVPELKRRGYRIATIKHSHEDVETDTPGKDSWRMARAGSDVVALSSPHRLAYSRKVEEDIPLEQLVTLLGDADIVLAEGFKEGRAPKIEVHRKEQGEGLLFPPNRLFAVVSDEPMKVAIPEYRPGDIAGIAGLIEQAFISRDTEDEVMVTVNDAPAYLKPYVEEVYSRVLMAITSTLKGVGDMRKVEVIFRRRVNEKRKVRR